MSHQPQESRIGDFDLDRSDLVILTGVVALGSLLFLNAQGKLLHPLIDAGREIYIPEQISMGAQLYQDFSYYYPPLAPYLISIPARLTSWNLPHVSAVGVLISLLVLALLYLLPRQFMSRGAAATTALLFVCVNFTSAYTFGSNFIFPYSYGAVLGILFFLAGTYFILRGLYRSGSGIDWWSGALFFIAAGWSKLELGFFGMLMILVASAAYLAKGAQSFRTMIRRLLLTAVLAALSLLVANLFLSTDAAGHWLFSQVLAPTLLSGAEAKRFYSIVTGSFMWQINLTAAGQGAGLTILYVAVVSRLDTIRNRWERNPKIVQLLEGILLFLVIGGLTILLTTERFLFFRAWTILQPLILVTLIILFVRHYSKKIQPSRESLQLLILLVGSIAVTSRIYLHVSPRWYGFWMTLPLYLLIAHLIFVTLPSIRIYSRRSTILWAPLIITICLASVTNQLRVHSEKVFPVTTPRGTFYWHDPHQAVILNGVLEHLRASAVDELVVMPEGLMINYLAKTRHPLWYHTFSPMEIGDPEIEADVLRNLKTEEPEWVLVSNLPYEAWEASGGGGFGRGYAVMIDQYLREEYLLEKEWRSPTLDFFLLRKSP